MKSIKEKLLLYAVTDSLWLKERTLFDAVEEALKGGVTFVQYREKRGLEREEMIKEAIRLKQLCHAYDVPFVIDDDVILAKETDADGVHVGQDDLSVKEARKILGKDKIVGATCKTIEQVKRAVEEGADYIGSGAVFGSLTKKDAITMPHELLKEITAYSQIPVVAIGGIDITNVRQLKNLGIVGVAVVSGIFAQDDIEKACIALKEAVREIV